MVSCTVRSVFVGPLREKSQFSSVFIVDFYPFSITLDMKVCKFITKVN